MSTPDPALFEFFARQRRSKVEALAKDMQENTGYLVRDIREPVMADKWAREIETAVAELRRQLAALEAMREITPKNTGEQGQVQS